jgi:hypothetical protein
MGKVTHRRGTAEVKARVTLEAIKGGALWPRSVPNTAFI